MCILLGIAMNCRSIGLGILVKYPSFETIPVNRINVELHVKQMS